MSSTHRGKEADTVRSLYEVLTHDTRAIKAGPNATKTYLKGRPEKGDGWATLKRAADKVEAANCTIVYDGKNAVLFRYQVRNNQINPIDVAEEEFRDLGCRKLGAIKAEDWVNPEEPGSDGTAEQEAVRTPQRANIAEQRAVDIQQQAQAAEETRFEEQRRSEEEALQQGDS